MKDYPFTEARLLSLYGRVAEAEDAIPRLRRFVLDLAVRGKLVPQDAGDEPASVLLERIEREKARLVKAGEIGKPKPLGPLAETPFSVPESWAWERLGKIALYLQRGKSPQYAQGDGLPVISQKCVQWTGLDLTHARKIVPASIAKYESIRFIRDGDLLWNSTGTGTIGRVVRVKAPPSSLVCDSHVTVVRCCLVNTEFIRCWLRSDHVYGGIEGNAAGSTNQVELTSQMANGLAVPLPPLAEQHRIVAKVEELMALLDRLEAARAAREETRTRLTAATLSRLTEADTDTPTAARFALQTLPALTTRPDQIKTLRQTILNLAVRGKLVEQDAGDEPASVLLKLISSEIARRRHEMGLRRQEPLEPVNLDDEPFQLPQGWAWARFPEVGVFARGKSKHRPRNDTALYLSGDIPFVQTGDVARANGQIETYSSSYNAKGLEQSMLWPAGTMCITIAANIADSGILTFDACFPDSVVGLLVASPFPHARFFEYFVRTAKANLTEFAPATAQKNINLGILETVLIPLPPLAEQHRIIAKVDELMSLCDRLERALQDATTTRARLLDATLREALAGAQEAA